jgi:hypothetical protein
MKTSGEEQLSRVTEDPDLREEFRADPEGAASRRGIELSEEERESLRELDTGGSDEQLAERVSKRVTAFSDVRLKRRIRPL